MTPRAEFAAPDLQHPSACGSRARPGVLSSCEKSSTHSVITVLRPEGPHPWSMPWPRSAAVHEQPESRKLYPALLGQTQCPWGAPARPPRGHPALSDPQSSPSCGAAWPLTSLTAGGSRGLESNDASSSKLIPCLHHTPSQPHGALPACPQLWGHQRGSEQDWVQLRGWVLLC